MYIDTDVPEEDLTRESEFKWLQFYHHNRLAGRLLGERLNYATTHHTSRLSSKNYCHSENDKYLFNFLIGTEYLHYLSIQIYNLKFVLILLPWIWILLLSPDQKKSFKPKYLMAYPLEGLDKILWNGCELSEHIPFCLNEAQKWIPNPN